jgi:hypothetical protein
MGNKIKVVFIIALLGIGFKVTSPPEVLYKGVIFLGYILNEFLELIING